MNRLKYELIRAYEEKNLTNFYGPNKQMEEGLLEKILNLSILNPKSFDAQSLNVIAVRSPVSKQRLYMASGRKHIFNESEVSLILVKERGMTDREEINSVSDAINTELLYMSIMYAARHFGVNTQRVECDFEAVKDEFGLKGKDVLMVISMGYFDTGNVYPLLKRRSYSETVREL